MLRYLTRISQLDADANDASEYATSNLFMWYRQNEGGLWLADALEDVGMTRRKNRHPWITYEADEELSCEDTEDLKDIDVDGIIRWRDAISSPSPPASINSHRNILTTSQGHPHESTDRQSG